MAHDGEALLSSPQQDAEVFSKELKRSSYSYEDHSERFKVKERRYKQQYSQLYYARLGKMKKLVEAKALKKWGHDYKMKSLAALHECRGEKCCIVGTLFKKMDLKPSILKEISATRNLVPQPSRVKYVGSNDELILEDQMQRVTLTGNISTEEMITGVVAALLGRELRNGCFEVEDYCFAGLPAQEEVNAMETDSENKYVLLVSGLNLGSSWCDQMCVEMLMDYITGQMGSLEDQQQSATIVRVIVAGNSITNKPAKSSTTKENKTRFLSRNYFAESIEAMKELDDFLTQIASCVLVDIMPGSHEPTNHQLPQQPLHRCMFPNAGQLKTLRGVTNPYSASFDGIRFLGSSGQNIDDIFKFSTVNDRLSILENTLRWGHMAPTAPDTLSCYPYLTDDPFIIDECPHVYFAGNQPSFQQGTFHREDGQSVLLLSVPNFDLTHSCVLVNLSSLEVKEMKFTTSLQQKDNPELVRQREIQAELDKAAHSRSADQDSHTPVEEMSILHHMDMDEDDED